jgi:glycosyltransferase involved in cell wall biosynthesis
MVSDKPLLSICIPTHSRSTMLRSLLEVLDKPGFLPFAFEVLVVENPSADEGYAAIAAMRPKHYSFSFHCRQTNIGGLANLTGALRMATGEFCLYLADDDRLVPEVVTEIVHELQADDAVAVGFAAWQAYDLVDDKVIHNNANFEAGRFDLAEAEKMLDWLMARTMCMPENGIYRTDAVRHCLFPSLSLAPRIVDLERLIRFGAVRFFNRAFVNFTWRHPDDPAVHRTTLGSNAGTDGWHRILHAFAVFHHLVSGKSILQAMNQATENLLFVVFGNAFLEAQRNRRFLEAWEQFRILDSLVPPYSPTLEERREIGFTACLQAIRLAALSFADTASVALVGFDDASAGAILAIDSGDDGPGFVFDDTVDYASAAILAPTAQIATLYQTRYGIPPGRVFSVDALRKIFLF